MQMSLEEDEVAGDLMVGEIDAALGEGSDEDEFAGFV